jgi:hypothetical protein
VCALRRRDRIDTVAGCAQRRGRGGDRPGRYHGGCGGRSRDLAQPRDPARSLVIGTDKKAGIHVYDLTGKRVSFTPAARLNNVDLRESGGRVIASNRADVSQAYTRVIGSSSTIGAGAGYPARNKFAS